VSSEPTIAPVLAAEAIGAPRSWGRWQLAFRSRKLYAGLIIVAPVLAVALLGPLLAPHDPTDFVGTPFMRPMSDALLGTDGLGRDVLSRFLSGGLELIFLALAATILGVGIGAIIGCFVGYVRGATDEIVMRLADAALAFPMIVLSLLFLSLLGPSPWLIIAVIAAGHAPRTLRVIRGASLAVVGRDFVQFCEAIGLARTRVVFREILPNVVAPLMVEFGIRFTFSVGLVAGLSFLGMGVQPPSADWGLMINENRVGLTLQPWAVAVPLVAIALLVIGCNLIADGIGRVVSGVEGRSE
jgi:peptide/nickel transport system permease protein